MASGNTPVLHAFSMRTYSTSPRDYVHRERKAWDGGDKTPGWQQGTVPGTWFYAGFQEQTGTEERGAWKTSPGGGAGRARLELQLSIRRGY